MSKRVSEKHSPQPLLSDSPSGHFCISACTLLILGTCWALSYVGPSTRNPCFNASLKSWSFPETGSSASSSNMSLGLCISDRSLSLSLSPFLSLLPFFLPSLHLQSHVAIGFSFGVYIFCSVLIRRACAGLKGCKKCEKLVDEYSICTGQWFLTPTNFSRVGIWIECCQPFLSQEKQEIPIV